MGKGKQEYDLDMNISLEGLKLAPIDPKEPEVPPEPARVFYNIVMSVISAFGDAQRGLNGHEHDMLKNIRTVIETALEKKETVVLLRDRELRWLNKMFIDTRTHMSTNEVRWRIKEKIQEALDPERKGDIDEGIADIQQAAA